MNEDKRELFIPFEQLKENIKQWFKTRRIKKVKIINGKLIAQEDISAGDVIEISVGEIIWTG